MSNPVQMIHADLTLEEARLVLTCLKNCPLEVTVEGMPKVMALAGSIARKLMPQPVPPMPPRAADPDEA